MTFRINLLADVNRLERKGKLDASVFRLFVTNASFSAAALYRLSHAAHRRFPPISRLISRLNLILNGADIDARAVIGSGLLLQHPVGVVIGNDCVIGTNVTFMSGVVLGRKNVLSGSDKGNYPTVGDGCLLGANAVVLGSVKIGDESIVGASSLVLSDVAEKTVVVGAPARAVTLKPDNQ